MDRSDEELIATNESAPSINSGALGLSAPEQAAFERTLYGPSSVDQGCLTEGNEAHATWSNGINDKYDDIDRRQQVFRADPRVASYYTTWNDCMASAEFQDPVAPMQVHIELTAEMRLVLDSRDNLELQELNQFEREIGSATVECGESSRNSCPRT